MRQNPARRTALLDAAIEVLAREGSRGLTFRAIDAEAKVPAGTSSNYFANRAELLRQIMDRTHERLTPEATALADTMQAGPSTELVTTLMHQLVDRMRADRSSYLAMLELRLEATRRPEIQRDLNKVFSAELDSNVRFHIEAGLPGDRIAVVLLYLATLGLIVDDLTVPETLAPYPYDELIGEMVKRLVTPCPE
ncbi:MULTISPECIES: TetR family transcriptional regulator [unclassified Streptomyces]|uniref:TetR/AcrR family transcriptional regulator n=1 Tax=unclassified Streptomyces TaxID=2593676 RepID=UPI002DD85A8A|nr:TetR family transcriptional regulator [Streptomyces sp. NBC_01750]WSA98230.1 TetR family transcriptional regulator [Streptomyces sp. NBC_01794]WSD37232.1 TetR family transcriptional regulator [Streptomyces sp. NBC_01750]